MTCWCPKEVHQHVGLHTGLCKFVQNIPINIWSLGKRTDLKLGEVPYLFISYNITISWPYTLNSFRITFLLRDSATQESHANPFHGQERRVACIAGACAQWRKTSRNMHTSIFDTGHPCCGQLTPVKTRYPLISITWPYRQLKLELIEVKCCFEVDRWPSTGF